MTRTARLSIGLLAALLAASVPALSRASPPSLPAPAPLALSTPPEAVAAAAQACRGVIESGQSPASAFAPAGLSGPGEAYPGLQEAFFPKAADLVWFRRTLTPGLLQGVVSASDRSCSLFLFSTPGRAAVDQVIAGLSGWQVLKDEAEARIFFRKTAEGATLVTSINLGPETVLPGQIGALIQVYRLPPGRTSTPGQLH